MQASALNRAEQLRCAFVMPEIRDGVSEWLRLDSDLREGGHDISGQAQVS